MDKTQVLQNIIRIYKEAFRELESFIEEDDFNIFANDIIEEANLDVEKEEMWLK